MANSFWNFVSQFTAGTLAKAEDVNTNFSGVAAGFDAVETGTDQAIKVTNAAGVTDVVVNAAARANKLLAFDASGDIIASQILGVWKGAHADAAGTDYQVRDVVRDDAGSIQLGSLYICNNTHTSTGSLLTDTANWDILVDATDLTTLGGFTASQYLRSDANDTYTGDLTVAGTIAGATSIAGVSITASGDLTGGTVNATGDTAADDNAAMGYTATEGLILTGQGSSNDVTIKNDADTVVINIPTGTTGVIFAGALTVGGVVQPSIPAQVTDHTRAGHVQVWTGRSNLTGLTVSSVVAEDAWESIGPTGSGADNIWDEMGVLPANATVLLVDVRVRLSQTGVNQGSVSVYVVDGDDPSPVVNTATTEIANLGIETDGTYTGNYNYQMRTMIPLGATNQDFQLQWKATDTDVEIVWLYYRGFMTD